MSDACHLCELATARPPEGVVATAAPWLAGSVADVPGWVMVQTVRHGDWLWDLTDEEASTLGPLLTRLGDAMHRVCGAMTVYALALGESTLHFHMLLIPRPPDAPPEMVGAGVVGKAAELADPARARQVTADIRAAFESSVR